jgi:hypothetical protein
VRDRALSGISKGGPIFARNLGGVVNPESSSSKANVKFDARFNPVHANFTTNPTAVASDNCALEPKTYYYAATGLGKTGEVGVDYNNINDWNYRSVNVSAGQKVTMSVSWMSNLKRRIYRGTSPGEFDGYWEWGTGVNPSPFVDDGNIPFTGKGMPPHTGDLWHRYEDDANYQIVATPSWATTVYVTNKATTGFTLNFSSAAPDANQTVSWLLFRP